MEKKLTAQGPTNRKSFTVTLPLEWVKTHKLEKKRVVELELIQDMILISPEKTKVDRLIIDGEEYSLSLVKVLQQAYRKGIDEIRVNFTSGKQLQTITKVVNQKLLGYEIMGQGKGYLLIKDITRESEENFSAVLRRVFLLLLELTTTTSKEQMNVIAENISKLINYCQRILMKRGHVEYMKVPTYYLVLDRLEKLKDEFLWLRESSLKLDVDGESLTKMTREIYKLYYSFNGKTFSKLQHDTFLLKQRFKFSGRIKKETIYLHNISRLLNSLCGDIYSLQD